MQDDTVYFLRLDEVLARVGFQKTKLYQMVREGQFPAPIKIGKRVRWADSTVEQWQQEKMSANG